MYCTLKYKIKEAYLATDSNLDDFNFSTKLIAKMIKKIDSLIAKKTTPLNERAAASVSVLPLRAYASKTTLEDVRAAKALIDLVEDESDKNKLLVDLLNACVLLANHAVVLNDETKRSSKRDNDEAAVREIDEEIASIFNSIPRQWERGAHIAQYAKRLSRRLCKFEIEYAEIYALIKEIADDEARDEALAELYLADAVSEAYTHSSHSGVTKYFAIVDDDEYPPKSVKGAFYRYDGVLLTLSDPDWIDDVGGLPNFSSEQIERYYEKRFKKALGQYVDALKEGRLKQNEIKEFKEAVNEYVPVLPLPEYAKVLASDKSKRTFAKNARIAAKECEAFELLLSTIKWPTLVGEWAAVLQSMGRFFDETEISLRKEDYDEMLTSLRFAANLAANTQDPTERAVRLLKVCKKQYQFVDDPNFAEAEATEREILDFVPKAPKLKDRLIALGSLVFFADSPHAYCEYVKDNRSEFECASQVPVDVDYSVAKKKIKKYAKLILKETLNPKFSDEERDEALGHPTTLDMLSILAEHVDAREFFDELFSKSPTIYSARRLRLLLNLRIDGDAYEFQPENLEKEALDIVRLSTPTEAVKFAFAVFNSFDLAGTPLGK